MLNGVTVARFGQLHPQVKEQRKLKQDVLVAEIDLDRLQKNPFRQPRYRQISRYPAVTRDFSFIFPDGVSFDQIQKTVKTAGLAELSKFELVELFRGKQIQAGHFSALLRATFQSSERTLLDDEAAGWSAKIIAGLKKLGGSHRATPD